MSIRPELKPDTDAVAFSDHYWLRKELVVFCRSNGLSTAGSKQDLTDRIAAMLTGTPQPLVQRRPSRKNMPVVFTRETPIGPGWRCSQALRAFISAEIGRPFRFDRFMRKQIKVGDGTSLGAAIDAWRKQEGRSYEIEPQFQYNRFTREYREHVPKAPHSEIVAAWRRYREMPSSQRLTVEQMAREHGESS